MTIDDESDRSPDSENEEDRLPDGAVVMRFGLSTLQTLHRTSVAHHDKEGDFAISVFCLPGKTADELARLGGLSHPKIRETTVAMLRQAGYDVVRDEPPEGHALVMLPRLPVDDDYVAIAATFDAPRENPAIGRDQDEA